MDGKTKAIVAHITFVGLIVSIVLNNEEKDELASFYIRQQLGLILALVAYFVAAGILGTILAFIPIIGWIISILLFLLGMAVGIGGIVFWIISLIGAVGGEPKELPLVGKYFQDWFKAL